MNENYPHEVVIWKPGVNDEQYIRELEQQIALWRHAYGSQRDKLNRLIRAMIDSGVEIPE